MKLALTLAAALAAASPAAAADLAEICPILGNLGMSMVEQAQAGVPKSFGLSLIAKADTPPALDDLARDILDSAYDWPLDAESFGAVVVSACLEATGEPV